MSEQRFSIKLHNSGKHRLSVHLESWGEVHVLKPDKTLRFDATGPVEASASELLEIRYDDESITMWGWSGSAITVSHV